LANVVVIGGARRRGRGGCPPSITVALGLAYLAFLWPTATYTATIIMFTFGVVGVVLALHRGLNIACPCMGNVLSVPLSTVTLTEDVLMVAMAIMLLMAN
jgi:hypothetical protein